MLCDVRTPFEDAARVFGPQKGAGPDDVRRLTSRLNGLARRLDRDPRGLPMTGAAGGLAGGLWAAFGAELIPGASFVLDAIGFDARMRAARAVVTARGGSTSRAWRARRCRRSRRAPGRPASRVTRSSAPTASTRSGARILDLDTIYEAGTVAQLRAAGRRLATIL